MKVRVFKGDDQQWYFAEIASNGEEIDRSTDGYVRRIDALTAAQASAPAGAEIVIDTED